MTHKELLDFAIQNGIIDESKLKALYEDMENEKYLIQHFGVGYELKKGRDGRYFTRLPNGKQVRTSNKDRFVQEIVSFYKGEPVVIKKNYKTVKDIFIEWNKYRFEYDNISKGTYDRSEADFKRFFLKNELAAELVDEKFNEITENELELFIKGTIKKYSLTPKGWANFKSLISGIWLYGAKNHETDLYITKFLDLLYIGSKSLRHKIENEDEQVFTDEEVNIILNEIKSHGFTPVDYGIMLCFYTGMRSGEISGLMWKDVSQDFRVITVSHMEVVYKGEDGIANVFEVVDHAKTTAGVRKIIIPDAFIPYFKTLKDNAEDNEFVFVSNGRRIHARDFSYRLYKLCKLVGLVPRRMHKIRKTVCSKLCDSGVDERFLLKQIGHTDRRTTEQFYHRDRRTLGEKCEIINSAISY